MLNAAVPGLGLPGKGICLVAIDACDVGRISDSIVAILRRSAVEGAGLCARALFELENALADADFIGCRPAVNAERAGGRERYLDGSRSRSGLGFFFARSKYGHCGKQK